MAPTTKIKSLRIDGSANARRATWGHRVKDQFATIILAISVELALSFQEADTSAFVHWESTDITASTVSLTRHWTLFTFLTPLNLLTFRP